MPDSTDYIAQLPQSQLTAEQLLNRLADLIINTTSVAELTNDAIHIVFGIQLETYDENRSDYAARLTPEWNASIELNNAQSDEAILEFAFFDSSEGLDAPMTEICGVDATSFASALTGAGFDQTTTYGVHGGIVGADFVRGPVRVMTSTRGEAVEPPEKFNHRCITSVWIRQRG